MSSSLSSPSYTLIDLPSHLIWFDLVGGDLNLNFLRFFGLLLFDVGLVDWRYLPKTVNDFVLVQFVFPSPFFLFLFISQCVCVWVCVSVYICTSVWVCVSVNFPLALFFSFFFLTCIFFYYMLIWMCFFLLCFCDLFRYFFFNFWPDTFDFSRFFFLLQSTSIVGGNPMRISHASINSLRPHHVVSHWKVSTTNKCCDEFQIVKQSECLIFIILHIQYVTLNNLLAQQEYFSAI